jgi:predicted Zn-dependent peptidase
VPDSSACPPFETLESRLLAARQTTVDSAFTDPQFEQLYQRLLAMEGEGGKAIYEFIRTQLGADGETRAYPTAKELLKVTQQVLVRLMEGGLKDSRLYAEVESANGLAFSMDLFTKDFMGQVFQPLGDEAWEKTEW